jgi:hypothetical protein
MKTLTPFLLAAGIAALIVSFFAAVPGLAAPAFQVWVVLMLLLSTAFQYRDHPHLGHD